jgi:ABC-2 type transport system permease protein
MLSAADVRAAAQSRIRWELLANLIRKDLKVKYKNSTLGFLWSLANPLLYLVVFDLVFSVFLRNNVPYFAVMFMSGLLVWNFFNLSTLSATGVVVGSANLVRKVRFPRVVLPLASVGFAAVHFVLQMLVFFVFLLAFYRDFIGPQLVLLVPALAVALIFTTGMALLVSALNVRYRDVEHLLEIILLAWFWLTPIVYPVSFVQAKLVPKHLFWIFMANPMTAVITSMQRAIYRHPVAISGGTTVKVLATDGYSFYLKWLGVAGALSVVLLALGMVVFRRMQADFAEEL